MIITCKFEPRQSNVGKIHTFFFPPPFRPSSFDGRLKPYPRIGNARRDNKLSGVPIRPVVILSTVRPNIVNQSEKGISRPGILGK